MNKPVIVTAFWDVGRSKDCAVPRSNAKYFEEFTQWARIQNMLIVFATKDDCDKVKNIRKCYGLENLTITVVTDDIFSVEEEIYIRMKKIEEKTSDNMFKYYDNAMSNRANFDYAWYMKYWCIFEATKYVNKDALLAWMDFGFNHIDRCYTNMEEFSFEWFTDVDPNKIHLFSLRDVESVSVIDALQLQIDTFMGVFHIVPCMYASEFWNLIKKAMESLIMLECLDDDQMLLLMAYRYQPNLFEIHRSSWFLPLKECGASHLTTREYNKNPFKAVKEKTVLSWKRINSFGTKSKKRARCYYGLSVNRILEYLGIGHK